MSPDLRGLSEKGKEEYPVFSDSQLKVSECEICGALHNVKRYEITRRDGTKATIELCYLHLEESKKLKPDAKIIPLDIVKMDDLLEEVKKQEQPEEDEKSGDSLLI